MRTKLIALVTGLLIVTVSACGQKRTASDYNYQRACEAFFDEDDDQKALELLNKHLEEDNRHADSYYIRARIHYKAGRYTDALRDIKNALQYRNRHTRVYECTLYGLRGKVYSRMELYDEAISALEEAVRLAKREHKDAVQNHKFELGQTYYIAGKVEQAEAVYLDMLKDDPGDGAAMIGLSRNCLDLEQYEKGLEWLEKAETYDNTYAQIYRFKMQILDKLGRIDEAADAAIRYWELDDDSPIALISRYAGKHYSYGVAKVSAMMNRNPSDQRWIFLLIQIHEDHCNYKKAISLYEQEERENGEHHLISYWKARGYSEMGEFEKAIAEINKAIEKSEDKTYVGGRGDIYRAAGRYSDAIADYSVMLSEDPTDGYYYYSIGWCYELQGNLEKALDYYNRGIDVDKTYAYMFLSRGDILEKSGHVEEAKADYEKVLELDDEADDGSCRQYALHGLGMDDEAIEWMDKIIENNPEDAGCYYDKACLLGRMGKTEEGLAALEMAFRKGYRRFEHLIHDDDMDPYRNTGKYKDLVNKYKAIYIEELNGGDEGGLPSSL